ncbi:DUF2177 family protein [Bauldia sp.]|uniref:DUF2177 family protein n=1 Tax=Bauldia sp. TaxID=2575872 RepID=UPI003BADAC1A
MLQYGIAYLATAVVFLAIDFVWLNVMSPAFYRPRLGDLLATNPNLTVAALFYLFYAVGVVVLVVMPAAAARSWLMAAGFGALFGFVAYGTYDFTNLATIRNWPVIVTVVDVIWGTALTAVSATAGYFAVRAVSSG